MSIQVWTYVIVGLSFALYIGIAWFAQAKTTAGFYIAGKGVHPIVNGMATGADWMSAASFMSMAGLISIMGYSGSVFVMGWTGGFVLLALLLAPYLRKFGKFTVPDFVGDRYYSNTARVVAVICAIFISFVYVAGQMRGVGLVFSYCLGINVELGVVIGMAIVFFYATTGGMKGITYTQTAQYVVLILAFLIPAAAISYKMTGQVVPSIGMGSKLTEGKHAGVYLLEALDQLHTGLGLDKYTDAFSPHKKPMLDIFCITIALMVGTAGLPHIIIRFYTVPTVKAARWSAFWALLFIGMLYLSAPAVAAFARVNLISTMQNSSINELPDWVKKWQKAELISIRDFNGNGKIDKIGVMQKGKPHADPTKPGQIEPYPDVDMVVDNDIMVMANPEIANLPAWVVALVAAGALAAALSTAAGLLLVISASISHDLGKRILKPDMTDKQEMVWARTAAGVAVVIAGIFGIFPPGFVAETVAFAFGLAASSFFPVIILGIFNKRTSREGAVSGMITGIGFTAIYIIYFQFIFPRLHNGAAAGTKDFPLGISPLGVGAVGMLINFIVALTVSAFTPPPPQDVQDMVERIRLPIGSKTGGSAH